MSPCMVQGRLGISESLTIAYWCSALPWYRGWLVHFNHLTVLIDDQSMHGTGNDLYSWVTYHLLLTISPCMAQGLIVHLSHLPVLVEDQPMHGTGADWCTWITYQHLLMISPCMVPGIIRTSASLTSTYWWSVPAWYRGWLVHLSHLPALVRLIHWYCTMAVMVL